MAKVKKKLGYPNLNPQCIGIEHIKDSALYNIVMYVEVEGLLPTVPQEFFCSINISEVAKYLMDDAVSTPTKPALLLALAQEKFKAHGWGKDRVESIIKRSSHV